jgi:chromosome segregation ATPase
VAENLREWERDYGPHEKMETRRAELTDDILRLKDAKKKDRESLEALRASWHRIFSRIVSFKNKEITALSQSIGLQADQIYEQQQELRKVEKHLARYKDIAQYHRTYEKMVENLRDSVWRRAKENPEFATMLIQDFGVLPGLKLVIEEVQRLAKLCKETGEAMHDTRTSSSAAYWDSVFYGR